MGCGCSRPFSPSLSFDLKYESANGGARDGPVHAPVRYKYTVERCPTERSPDMKATIEIADALAGEAKAHAAKQNVALRSLVERGLRMVLRADRQVLRFELRDASVGGRGMQSTCRGADWRRIRQASYTDQGS